MRISLTINGQSRQTMAAPDTPLLYVLRNDLALSGAKFGCGAAQCGACTVLLDGAAVRSCVLPISNIGNAGVTTLEGLAPPGTLHALQQAFIDEQAAQCGYCSAGMIMSAKALLDVNKNPSEGDIGDALAGNLCRCGTHRRIIRAVQRAARSVDAHR